MPRHLGGQRRRRFHRVSRKRAPRPDIVRPLMLAGSLSALVLQLGVIAVVITVTAAGAATYYHRVTTQGLARLRAARFLAAVPYTRILDRHGRLLAVINNPTRGLTQNEPLSRIPRYMQQAVVDTEDSSFWSNPGFSPRSVARAALYDYTHRAALQGASGITQQLVKRMVLDNQDTVLRKLQEVLISFAATRQGSGFSKSTILALYLNTVFFGHEAYGVEAAARVFFGKHIWQLDLAQCALLAGLVQEPSYYDPLGPTGPNPAKLRLSDVLGRMRAVGDITVAQQQAARAEASRFVFSAPYWQPSGIISAAPYWTDWIIRLLTYGSVADLNNGWYTDPQLAAVVAAAGGLANGLTIKTTLDLDLYRKAQQIMAARLSELAGLNATDAAVVVMDPQTAECLALVGGLNYYGSATGSQINMATVRRSPGSSFKLYTYLTAFKQGWSPARMLLDEPAAWPDLGEPNGVYAPIDYDLHWHGAVTVRMALANSLNMPAVKTLAAVGFGNVIKTAEDLGVRNLGQWAQGAGLSLTLGSVGVPLWQMAQAYNVVAAGGVFRPMASILSITAADGTTIYRYHPPVGMQVIAPQYAYLMTSILSDNEARLPEFGSITPLRLGNPGDPVTAPAAVKTGTSQVFKDNLTIGFTPNLLTATWVGNPDDSPMINVSGVDGAGPIWHDLMEWELQHRRLPVEDFKVPRGIFLAHVSSSGYLADGNTAWPITDVFAAGTVPHQADPGTGDPYTEFRVFAQDFSVYGGALDNATAGPLRAGKPLSISTAPASTAPLSAPTTGSTVPSGTSGVLSYRPSDPNLCGGRYYTYYSVYVNGQLMWRYTCQ